MLNIEHQYVGGELLRGNVCDSPGEFCGVYVFYVVLLCSLGAFMPRVRCMVRMKSSVGLAGFEPATLRL